ncbi:MAG: hypothetical protein OES14_05225 [Nitrosopumilus sp.]|nr:hypothetical protein [Nitrosopumilus sp.]MDH3825174.1 hypothetical protein [Nitrosopumilus sp.]
MTELKSIIKTPITIPPNTSILDARDILLRHRIGEPLSNLDKVENMKIKIMLEKKLHEFIDNKFSILCPYNNCEIESGNKTKWLSHLFQNNDGAIFSPKDTEGLSIYF